MTGAKYYHALNNISALGPIRIKKMVEHFGGPEKAWKAAPREFNGIEGFGETLLSSFFSQRAQIDPDIAWQGLLAKGFSVVTLDDVDYPPLLREIYDPPPVLYYTGKLEYFQKTCLAIVGSRRHTPYGKEIAYKFASKLSNYDLTIVSGMARGIDTWVHKGVLEAGGKTAAVLGCGLDICYPAENMSLKDQISTEGAVITEFPPGSKPLSSNFPRRNRIISGITVGTLVLEAGEKSGALITAEFALEQGRDVFAVPGGIGSPYSRGCHRLIKEGAKLVERVEDILEELPFSMGSTVNNEMEMIDNPLLSSEIKVLEAIHFEPLEIEEIARLSGFAPAQLYSVLSGLEIKGVIRQLPGKYFQRV